MDRFAAAVAEAAGQGRAGGGQLMPTMQPRPEFVQYRENVPQWRVWNVSEWNFPPFALVALLRDVGPASRNLNIARTAYDMHPTVERHAADVSTDNQITYESVSGPQSGWNADGQAEGEPFGYHGGIEYPPGFHLSQVPETYLALFDRGLKPDADGLATQHWPVLTRYTGDASEIPETWPRHAAPDLDNFGVTLDDDGPFQILDVHPNKLPDCSLVWIAPRHIAYRDAWAVGSVDSATGNGEWQELKGATDALNSPGNEDVLTIEDGRIIAHKLGLYRATINAVASGDPPNTSGIFRLAFLQPGPNATTPEASRGETTGVYGWLPTGTEAAQSHTHGITVTGGAAGSYPWDRTTSVLMYTTEFVVDDANELPWAAKLLWNGAEGDTLTRVRYHLEYIGPGRAGSSVAVA